MLESEKVSISVNYQGVSLTASAGSGKSSGSAVIDPANSDLGQELTGEGQRSTTAEPSPLNNFTWGTLLAFPFPI